jgi:hypothetical protein
MRTRGEEMGGAQKVKATERFLMQDGTEESTFRTG